MPEYRELTIPSGTTLSATLATSLASDTSKVEDAVRATLKSPVSIEGFELLPSGTTIVGHVVSVQQSAKVKGRASIAFRFNSAHLHEGPEQFSSATIVQEAASTKGKDATKVGVGAGIGAVIGGIAGGGAEPQQEPRSAVAPERRRSSHARRRGSHSCVNPRVGEVHGAAHDSCAVKCARREGQCGREKVFYLFP